MHTAQTDSDRKPGQDVVHIQSLPFIKYVAILYLGWFVKFSSLERLLALKVVVITSGRSIGVATTWLPWPITIVSIYTTRTAKNCRRIKPTCIPISIQLSTLNGTILVSMISCATRNKHVAQLFRIWHWEIYAITLLFYISYVFYIPF